MGARPTFAAGAAVVTITDALRVRSRPEVSDASTKYEPTLPNGTELHVLAGPVSGSGYWWYRVELVNGVTLYHGFREGWVAAATRDGSAWLGPVMDVDCHGACPSGLSPIPGWPSVKRADIVMTGELLGDPDPDMDGGLAIGVRLAGLLPRMDAVLTATGTYEVEWVCTDPAGIEAKGPATISPVVQKGTTTAGADAVIDPVGAGSLTLILRPTAPSMTCPSGYVGPVAWSGHWNGLRVDYPTQGLVLTPGSTFWDSTL